MTPAAVVHPAEQAAVGVATSSANSPPPSHAHKIAPLAQTHAAESEQQLWYAQHGRLFVSLQAIDAFLQKMRLTLSDIKSRPGLAAAVAAYHGEGGRHSPGTA